MDELLTPQEAAAYLKMSVSFVRKHAQRLGALRFGGGNRKAGRLRFREQDLRQFIADCAPAPRRPNNETSPGKEPKRMAG